MKNITYGVETNDLSANRSWGTPDDYSVWCDTLEEALDLARKDAQESGEEIEIMKYTDDEVDWDYPITVDPDGGAWSEDYRAREELGVTQ